MTTAVAKVNIQLPAHLQGLVGQYTGGGAAGGIRSANYPRISVDGGKFFLVKDGQKQLINDPANPAVPLMQFNMVVVGWSPELTKTYYQGEYKEGDSKEPTCSSEDGITPDDHIDNPQNPICNGCPMNEWGSAVSKYSGKKTKACEDSKRIAILPTVDLGMFAMGLSIKPASLKNWADYVRQLEGMGVALWMVETQVTFDYTVSFPKLKFAMNRFLTAAELTALAARGEPTKHGVMADDINLIVRPRGNMARASVVQTVVSSAPASDPGHPVTTDLAAPAAPVVAPQTAPAQLVGQITTFGTPPQAAPSPADPAGVAFGGIPTPATSPGFAFGAPPAAAGTAVQGGPVPPIQQSPPSATAPVSDWKAGLPDAVVAGVNAVGGPDSDMGKQLIALAAGNVGAKEPEKRTRAKKADAPQASPPVTAPVSSAPASPAPAAIVFPSAPGAAPSPSAPAPATSPAPGMAMSLTDMLKNALGG